MTERHIDYADKYRSLRANISCGTMHICIHFGENGQSRNLSCMLGFMVNQSRLETYLGGLQIIR